ncbi:hypothetical protein GCM10010213_21100 [Microbacterium maritypicum]|uniref:Uncharacterized protein n=1 Tax=Microbacterium maritypicum TaxID=33918 RepID=A0A4Y4B9A6_MICMQ|nr:hypothetical protein MLI01_22070 [Microbacterium liquefaciens]GGV58882.1 hypothetical protein GCM10010213_21100 [Microbacterium liquefaciens]
MQHSDRAVLRGDSLQQRQRDGVVATDRDDALHLLAEGQCRALDLAHGLGEVERARTLRPLRTD